MFSLAKLFCEKRRPLFCVGHAVRCSRTAAAAAKLARHWLAPRPGRASRPAVPVGSQRGTGLLLGVSLACPARAATERVDHTLLLSVAR